VQPPEQHHHIFSRQAACGTGAHCPHYNIQKGARSSPQFANKSARGSASLLLQWSVRLDSWQVAGGSRLRLRHLFGRQAVARTGSHSQTTTSEGERVAPPTGEKMTYAMCCDTQQSQPCTLRHVSLCLYASACSHASCFGQCDRARALLWLPPPVRCHFHIFIKYSIHTYHRHNHHYYNYIGNYFSPDYHDVHIYTPTLVNLTINNQFLKCQGDSLPEVSQAPSPLHLPQPFLVSACGVCQCVCMCVRLSVT
jgi:hypothetical protein